MSEIDELKTRAEITNCEETSRYDEVMRFIQKLEQLSSGLMRVETFGTTEEGRNMPLMIFGAPDSAKPTVFIMANIHAGEVEGKEAVLHMSRRLVAGDLKPLLDKLFILIAPIYNADGNERISPDNRSEQYGPIGGVGTRENAKGLDLNRDYMKLESVEARALVGLMSRWNPHLTVDLHTTNGSYHGYHLTFSSMLNPNAEPDLIEYERDEMLPAIARAVSQIHGYRTYFYGNFARRHSMNDEIMEVDSTSPAVWRTFDHRPRFGNNYVGLRNRLVILSEAYSYIDFRERIGVTTAFIEEILKYTANHAADVIALLDDIQPPSELGVEFELEALPKRVEILAASVEKIVNPRSGREMLGVVKDSISRWMLEDYGVFGIRRRVAVPAGYVVPRRVQWNLAAHGIRTEELDGIRKFDVERFVVDQKTQAETAFQGHHAVQVRGHGVRETVVPEKGSLFVSTDQPLARLIFYLIDPESDDGMVTWGLLQAEEILRVSL